MKVKFECKYCGKENYFKTEETTIELSENNGFTGTETYLPKCNKCGKRNAVEVNKS